MYLSLNWLKEFVDVPEDVNGKKLGELLTMHTVEIEGEKDQANELSGVVVGELVKIKKHPNADKLHIAQVDVGRGKSVQLIFGQMVKMKVGDKVPVALAPTTLPGGRKISKTKLRGVLSEGMLCLEQELGLKKDGVDIHYFGEKVKNGTPISEARGLNDVIFDIDNKSLTHRPDLWGVYGLSREVAAILGHTLKQYPFKKIRKSALPHQLIRGQSKIEVLETKLCPRYIGFVMGGVKIGPSADWMQARLESVGVRAINNIVDITNYIMLELGQPMHAFDFKNIQEGQVVIRRAKKGEKLVTLDNVSRVLDDSMLVIADKNRALALAGVMGGALSEIKSDTNQVFIEAANFSPVHIRQTSSKLNLRTESSMRFEKNLDPNLAEVAAYRFIELTSKLMPDAKLISPVIDKNFSSLTLPEIELKWDFLHKYTGIKIDERRVVDILRGLGFYVKKTHDGLNVLVPSWRATGDVSIREDLVEEVARIYGYGQIVPKLPAIQIESPKFEPVRTLERKCKEIFAGHLGWIEVYNYSFVNQKLISKIGDDEKKYIKLKNPLSGEYTHLRRNFLPLLLLNIEKNLREFNEAALFETGFVYLDDLGGLKERQDKNNLLPAQNRRAGGIYAKKSDDNPLAQVKELIFYTMQKLGIEFTTQVKRLPVYAHPSRSTHVIVKDAIVGFMGEVHPKVLQNFGIKERSAVWNINLEALTEAVEVGFVYKPLPKFPSVKRDMSLVLNRTSSAAEILSAIKKFHPSIYNAALFDVYYNKGKGTKNLTFHLAFLNQERTLSMEEVNKVFDSLAEHLRIKFKARLHD
jgi:phenylalanyl-tRNA synthetase beta chain